MVDIFYSIQKNVIMGEIIWGKKEIKALRLTFYLKGRNGGFEPATKGL